MKQLFCVLFVCAAALASGTWERQLNGIGAGPDRRTAEDAALQNLRQNLQTYSDQCAQAGGAPQTQEYPPAHCEQTFLDYKCIAVGKITCYFP